MFRYLIFSLIAFSASAEDLSTLIEQADVIVLGRGVSGSPGNRDELYSILKAKQFEVLLPFYASPIEGVRVREVLKGQATTNEVLNFYRLSDIMLRTQDIEKFTPIFFNMDGIWLLCKIPDSKILYATDYATFQPQSMLPVVKQILDSSTPKQAKSSFQNKTPKPNDGIGAVTNPIAIVKQLGLRSIPLLRSRLLVSTASEKKEIIDIIKRYGLIPMIPDLIGLISDGEPIPREYDVIFGRVGEYACYTLGQIAYKLDGIEIKERGLDNFSFHKRYPQDYFYSITNKITINWELWWKSYRQYGPKTSQSGRGE